MLIRDLSPGEIITSYFGLRSIEIKTGRNGKQRCAMTLCNSSGDIPAVWWDFVTPLPESKSVVKVQAEVGEYQEKLQLSIRQIRVADEGEYLIQDIIPVSQRDPTEMVQELAGIIGTIQNDSLRELLRFILATHGEALKQAPAAMRLHHATRGGLLEHILSMIQIVLRITDFARFPNPVHNNYARLDTDLLIAGCILHDIGKIVELDPGIGFDYTTMGRLVGHVSIGVQILNEAIQQVPWEPQVYRKLVHMILSHHGEPEWGAAMRPMFPEAIMLHMIDKMDATLEMIWREMDASAAEWTPYIPAMERALYRGVQE